MNNGLMAAAGAIRRKRRKRRYKLKNISLTLSNATMPANSIEGTVVGNILNKLPGTYVSLIDTSGGRFKLVGLQIQAGAIASIAGSYTIVLRQELSSLGTKDSSIAITVV